MEINNDTGNHFEVINIWPLSLPLSCEDIRIKAIDGKQQDPLTPAAATTAPGASILSRSSHIGPQELASAPCSSHTPHRGR